MTSYERHNEVTDDVFSFHFFQNITLFTSTFGCVSSEYMQFEGFKYQKEGIRNQAQVGLNLRLALMPS